MLGRLGAGLILLAVIVVFFAFIGVALYIGIFVFAILLLYGVFLAIKDELVSWWQGRGFNIGSVKANFSKNCGGFGHMSKSPKSDKQRRVIDMGDIEIITPAMVQGENVLWKNREGLSLKVVYEGSAGRQQESEIRLFEINTRRSGAVYFEAICFADNTKCTLEMKKIIRIYDQDGEVLTPRQFLLKKGIG